jgi:nicotinamidase-related amidase
MNATALLVMDVQRGIVERFDDPGYLQRVSDAAGAARAAGIPVVYVVIGFRPGHPEISPQNQTFAAVGERGGFVEGEPATEIHPAVAPQPGDLVVTKRRVSAFTGSDLEVVLRGLRAQTRCGRPLTSTTGWSCSPTRAWTRTPRCTGS